MEDSVRKAFEEQIRNELHAAYVYLGMSAYFDVENLSGFAHWMLEQSREEVGHAMRLFEFLRDRGIAPQLLGVGDVPSGYESPLAAVSAALDHERGVTAQINKLYELSLAHHDYPAQILLQWFVNEQLEEEKSTSTIVERLKMVEGSRSALLILDAELSSRQGDTATA